MLIPCSDSIVEVKPLQIEAMAKRKELKDSLITFLRHQRDQCRPLYEPRAVERRGDSWDRRAISDRRSSIFPNQTDYSRRSLIRDRRDNRTDRRQPF
jgi:hypothetical protein